MKRIKLEPKRVQLELTEDQLRELEFLVEEEIYNLGIYKDWPEKFPNINQEPVNKVIGDYPLKASGKTQAITGAYND